MKKTQRIRFSLLETVYRHLREQDEEKTEEDTADDSGDEGDDTGDETAEDDLFGDAEGGDDTGADETGGGFSGGGGGGGGGAGGGDSGGKDSSGGKPAEDEEEDEVSPEEEYKLSDSIDQELDALMVDFEEEARKSAVVNTGEIHESYLIFEEASADIDLRHFAGNIARFIKNYQNLIDWESVILNKTEMFVNNHYGEETVKALFDILEQEHDIEKENKRETDEAPDAPIAVGASNAGGG